MARKGQGDNPYTSNTEGGTGRGKALARFLGSALLLGWSALVSAEDPDISGIWLPLAGMNEAWDLDQLPLSEAAQSKLREFDRQRHDSTKFCMPFGTPRNMLNAAPYPIEILQTDKQITLIFDQLSDLRRIFTDGRPLPEDPIHSWMGHSVGRWDDEALLVDTIAMTHESILNDAGLPHSEAMRLEERFELVEHDGKVLLKDELTIHDAHYYDQPLTATRYYVRAEHTPLAEGGSAACLLDQWRGRLEEVNRELYRDLQRYENGGSN